MGLSVELKTPVTGSYTQPTGLYVLSIVLCAFCEAGR